MDPAEKEQYALILAKEINLFLGRMYRKLGRSRRLKPVSVDKSWLVLKSVSASSSKAWEFVLNPKECVAKGDVGSVIIATNGLKRRIILRQRALLIAAEIFTYHSFARLRDPALFDMVKSQNQYLDFLKKVFRRKSSAAVRDTAVRYIIESIGEHALAHFSGYGWFTRIGKLRVFDHRVASALGVSEKVFNENCSVM